MSGGVTALEGRGLSIVRGGRLVLDDLGFRIGAGEALIATGPNGVGKSTLLRAVAGLLPLTAGQITVERDGTPNDEPAATLMHYLGHLDALKPALTLEETLAFWMRFLGAGAPSEAGIEAALDAVGLADLMDLPAGYLSAGQRRRLAIARLLVAPRPIWLLDEPTAALDAASEATLGRLMAAHLAGGGLILAATHLTLPGIAPRTLALATPVFEAPAFGGAG